MGKSSGRTGTRPDGESGESISPPIKS
jgi:hypothetical protein